MNASWARATAGGGLAVLAMLLVGCGGGSQDPTRDRDKCLYAAIAAYPTWTDQKVSVIDGLPACRAISEQHREDLRGKMQVFFETAVTRELTLRVEPSPRP